MVNMTLAWLLLIPFLLSVASFFVLQRVSNMPKRDAAIFSVGGLLISALIMSGAFYLGKGSKTADTEIWNGRITGKTRIHDHYVESYQCNCVQSCSTDSRGNRSCSETCQTCYEDHYTVKWKADSTIGDYTIESLDKTSKRVYETPDPPFYSRIKIGEACSKEHSYTNYIKAVPESLFRPAAESLKAQFKGMIPAYPGNIYNFWHINRVISVGVPGINTQEWNTALSDTLRDIGPVKQANAIIVLVKTDDPNYMYALQDAWVGGKKNDIIMVIGTQDGKKANWVSILALTDSELFKVTLRDDLLALNELTATSVTKVFAADTVRLFKRKPMSDFEYLDAEIDPPTWVNVTSSVTIIAAYLLFWLWASVGASTVFRFRFR